MTLSTMLFALLENWIVGFLSSCWNIEQSYHRTSRPCIYSTIRVVVVLMGPSISLCEGQGNTCINKNTRTCTHTRSRTQMLSHSCCGGTLMGVSCFSAVVWTRQKMCLHQGNTCWLNNIRAWLSFNVSRDSRLNTQSHIWSPVATACVKDVTEL